jgi:hypothetical protein
MTNYAERPPSNARPWRILDVMVEREDSDRWVALLIDVDPDAFCAGEPVGPSRSCYLRLGPHLDRDAAWAHAEDMLATRH